LAALIPKPRANLTRYHGVLARGGHPPNHRWRGLVTPAKRGRGVKRITDTETPSPAERHIAMSWAQRLKRVFNIDIETCGRCGGTVKVIAGIEDQDIIDRILAHLRDAIGNKISQPCCRCSHHLPAHHLRRCLCMANSYFINSMRKSAIAAFGRRHYPRTGTDS